MRSIKQSVIQKDVTLTHLNTLGLPSLAPLFIEINSLSQLEELGEAGFFEDKLPFILGGGSNIVLSNRLSIPVLKISIEGIEIVSEDDMIADVEIGAGEVWQDFVTWAVDSGLGGVENLALIPGTVGAAPIQNIGAYGVELETVFLSLKAYHLEDRSVRIFSKDECNFGYRDSIFKQDLKGRCVVVSVTLRLKKRGHVINDSYHALKEYLERSGIQDKPTIEDIYRAVIAIRKSKLPDPSEIGNAGSFFKNPVIDQSMYEEMQRSWGDVPGYPDRKGKVKIPAAWLIEKAGWKGLRVGNVGTYETQALVIVNHGEATGAEIIEHAGIIQKSVVDLFGIELIPEVNIIR